MTAYFERLRSGLPPHETVRLERTTTGSAIAGEFVWHSHEDTDELFLVIDGTLTIQLRDGDVSLGPGQLFVVPRGVEHCPIADGEVHAVLIEPSAVSEMTATYDDSLA